MGHMLNQTEMDILTRWRRMQGRRALWLPGTDHAGIATQMMVERQLTAEGSAREKIGREAFVERVWEWRRHYGGAILDQMKRLGASVDWNREYFTMDARLSVAVREAFVRLYEQGLIYRGAYIVNWCPRCQTAISDLEVVYDEHKGHLWEIRYPVIDDAGKDTGEFLTIATTRPETMLGDVAVAVHPEDERYAHLHGRKLRLPLMDREIPVITDEWVSREFGTGAVKVTPAHDPNDFALGERHHLPSISVMDTTAKINENGGPYAGLDRFVARKKIVADLEEQGLLAGIKDHVHNVGHCDRCKTVVEPRLSTQWFVKIQPLAEKAIAAVKPDADGKQGHSLCAGDVREDLPELDGEHPRLVHQPAVVVGASHSGVALREVRQDDGGAAGSGGVRALRVGRDYAGDRRAGHLVFIGAAAGVGVRLAQRDGGDARGFRHVLSDQPAGDGIRHPVFLGGADDHAGMLVLFRCSAARWFAAPVEGFGAVPRGLHPCAGARRQPGEDVEDQGERDRPHRDRGASTGPMRCGSRWRRWLRRERILRSTWRGRRGIARSPTRFGTRRDSFS